MLRDSARSCTLSDELRGAGGLTTPSGRAPPAPHLVQCPSELWTSFGVVLCCVCCAVSAMWSRLSKDIVWDSWRIRANLFGTILTAFGTILEACWDHFATCGSYFGIRGPMQYTCPKKVAQGPPCDEFRATILGAIFARFRARGPFFGERLLDLILERPREQQNSEKDAKRFPKWNQKWSQQVIFVTSAKCELDIVFVILEAHWPSQARSKKACKIGAAIGRGPGGHW